MSFRWLIALLLSSVLLGPLGCGGASREARRPARPLTEPEPPQHLRTDGPTSPRTAAQRPPEQGPEQ